MSCLRTAIVGPILSAKEKKNVGKGSLFVILRGLDPHVGREMKRRRNKETDQELEESMCRHEEKAWLVYEQHQDYHQAELWLTWIALQWQTLTPTFFPFPFFSSFQTLQLPSPLS